MLDYIPAGLYPGILCPRPIHTPLGHKIPQAIQHLLGLDEDPRWWPVGPYMCWGRLDHD